jgi:hypothetical protein
MSLKHEFNRIAHLFNDGVQKTEKHAGQWFDKGAHQAGILDRRVREQARTGQRNLVSAEEAVVRHMRGNPAIYLIGAALLIGVLVARLVVEAQREPRAPLL